ncbi:MAG: DsbA family oxidoreductase [Woeseiaceae bacterium]|nr:DsbA family oxidoreductase [Gammaproteobacteria bacterium]NNK25745.1 DsbA family oxidoreductase [Woeseiaceae bacterium]NNL63359.1 DsbA family oxidoreductase [Woeseiaceae bacterium]
MSETLFNIVQTNDRVAPTATLHVEVIADFVCPFCFLGKRRLDKALEAVEGPSDVSWYPFQLNPEIPAEGQPFDAYLGQRFGGAANIEPILEQLAAEGRADGVRFAWDKIRHVPNTLPMHQLMQHAAGRGKDQVALADDLMSAFFEEGRNIGERDVLVDIAGRHGIRGRDMRRALDNDLLRQSAVSREAQVRSSGLNTAPGFLINRRLLVVGAQPTDNLVNAFDRAMFGEGTDSLVSPALH